MSNKIFRSALALLPEKSIKDLEEFRKKYILHPSSNVPFHVTLLPVFFLPEEINDEIEDKIKGIAINIDKFPLYAKPLSSFPTNGVLYLNPSPVGPLEDLTQKLFEEFPKFGNRKYGFQIFHMTIASQYKSEDRKKIIDEYIEKFGYGPLSMIAGSLAVFCECETGEWKVYRKYSLGDNC